jgi:hypothetical protein
MNTRSGGIDLNFSIMVSGCGDSTAELSGLGAGTDDGHCSVFTWLSLLQFITDFHVRVPGPGARSNSQNLQLTYITRSKHTITATTAPFY